MKKAAYATVLILLLSNILEIGLITHPVRASGEAEPLKMTTLEDLSILGNGTVQVKILMNASSGPLADMYRKMLAAPATVGIEEEVPIPENTTEKIDAGGNVTDVSMPVREGFFESIVKEQLLSLGLRTEIIESDMVPKGNANECRVMMSAFGSFEVFNVTGTDSNETWEVGIGPFNTTGITGLVLTRLMFTQMMLGSLPGEQVYQNSWQTKIRLPVNAVLLNGDLLFGLNWTIDFNGGTYLKASVSLDETATIQLNEDIVVTEDNITATPEYLSNVLANYKAFKIRYSLPSSEKRQNESKEQGSVNTNWSYPRDTGWVSFPDIPLLFRYADSKGDYLDMKLTVSPKFRVVESVGWQFFYDWHFPFIHLDKFWAQMNFSTSIRIRLEANATIVLYDHSWYLFQLKITYPFYYGVPGWIDLVFTVNANLHIEGTMAFVAQTVVNGELDTSVTWNHTNGWDNLFSHHLSGNLTDIKWWFAIGISVTPSVSFRMELLFYSVAGPFVEFRPYFTLTGELVLPDKIVSCDITVAFDITGGVTFAGWLRTILGLSGWDWRSLHKELAHWTGTWNLEPPPTAQSIHDLMIVSLIVPSSEILSDTIVDINVTVRNNGNYDETSNVTLFQNNSLIKDWGAVNFTSASDKPLLFPWNTSGLKPGSYILKARVNPVNGENNITDNEINITVQIVTCNDIAIVGIRAYPDEIYVGQTVNVTVAVKNLGELTEDSNVTLSANQTSIETRSIQQLAPNESIALAFPWNSSGSDPGQYVIWANVSTLHYDINMTNNNLTSEENVVKLRLPWHDVAVTVVKPYRNWVYQGRVVNINVTIINEGDLTETTTVKLYYNITAKEIIGKQTAVLNPGQKETLTFAWNTISVPYCHNYTITAVAEIPFDSNMTNNLLADGKIKVRILGDIDGDGKVDIFDVRLIAVSFGSFPGDPKWNPDYDLNQSGGIDMFDIRLAVKNFGKCS